MDPVAISPIALFLQAGIVGKSVMLLLLAMSVWCWVLIFVVAVSVGRLRRAVGTARAARASPMVDPILTAGAAAERLTIPGETVGERRSRVQETMNRGGRILIARIEGGLPNMAVISSVAPFIGLFGTVWGIITAFSGIAEAKDTSLAVVAPGIAEALAATAIGLAAAIPASFGYSYLGGALGRAAADLYNLIEERSVAILARPAAGKEAA
ncbi:MAG: MotA/TolQ/ExbB proton channel family protein [Ancalomicrobiaceae bacterium]|nr:MotA/TolQ/ExbB proton channel family protein [Ancalomicrobiaceae bacterium]